MTVVLEKLYFGGNQFSAVIETSSDNVNWTTFNTISNITSAFSYTWTTMSFWRYWRIRVTAFGTNSAMSVANFYLYRATGYSDIRSILPADSVSLGVVRTDSTKPIEADDASYKYGRREGVTGGNRIAFLGWKYFYGAGSTTKINGIPFGTPDYKIVSAKVRPSLSQIPQECSIYGYSGVNGGSGVWYEFGINGGGVDSITLVLNANVAYNNTRINAGFIGLWVEVIE